MPLVPSIIQPTERPAGHADHPDPDQPEHDQPDDDKAASDGEAPGLHRLGQSVRWRPAHVR